MKEENPLQTDDQLNTALDIAKQKTRRYITGLWEIVARHSRIGDIGEKETAYRASIQQHEFHNQTLLRTLSLVPYILVALFTGSFFWDFDGISVSAWGYLFEIQGLLRILSVSGLIGFLTNWLAITMLFKPAKKRPLLGHGLIPAQKNRIAFRLAQAVSEDLINPKIIKQKIQDSNIIARYRKQSTRYIKGVIDNADFREDLKSWVVHYIDDMIADPEIRGALAGKIMLEIDEALKDKSIERVALKAYSFVRGQEMQQIIEEALSEVPTSIENGLDKMDALLDQLPEKLDEHSEAIENIVTALLYKIVNQLDVHNLVEDNLKKYDEQHLSDIIHGATNEQLKYIQYLGAVLGMIGGFIIWEPLVSIVIFGFLLLGILSLDVLIARFIR